MFYSKHIAFLWISYLLFFLLGLGMNHGQVFFFPWCWCKLNFHLHKTCQLVIFILNERAWEERKLECAIIRAFFSPPFLLPVSLSPSAEYIQSLINVSYWCEERGRDADSRRWRHHAAVETRAPKDPGYMNQKIGLFNVGVQRKTKISLEYERVCLGTM